VKSVFLSAAATLAALSVLVTPAAAQAPVKALEGLWEARGWFGPGLRGRLVVDRTAAGWSADLMGRTARGEVRGADVLFDFGRDGRLRIRLNAPGGAAGWWTQGHGPFSPASFITPVELAAEARGRWSGRIEPVDDTLTLFMPVTVGADGQATTYLRNPERNVGRMLRLGRVELAGDEVSLVGRPFGAREDTVVGRGRFDPDNDILSVYVQRVGQTYEFHRVRPGQASGFHPRGSGPAPYRYLPPPARDDGWPVGTIEEAGIDRAGLERFIQHVIDLPVTSLSTSDVHAVLIARRGRLVVEEYFHGMDRNQRHDTRSAGKSIAATIVGAVINAGHPLSVQTPVYATLGLDAPDMDPRKRAIRMEHLLLQTAGFHCDDDDENAPGNEDRMQGQREQPDWYRYSLATPMISAPGEAAPVYCSMQPNLMGAVTAKAAGQRLEDLFADLVARPMGIRRYALNTQPTGEYYWGGGAYLEPRDFLKFAQVMMDGGTWRGRRVVSRDWARRSTAPLENFGNRQYGYLWWSQTYPYKGGEVRAFYAAGNGGQIAMAIPELDLVVGFMGGNYSDGAALIPQREYVPNLILPGVSR